MSGQASFALRGRNPDVLTCIANLSNDEVFTPPEFANRMLDTLAEAWAADNGGANIWADRTVRFLDPFTKSGVFLREITSRLTKGLADEIPDLQERVDHILTKQVFGIGITHLTSLLARRSVYCSKHAKGEHSIAKGFASDAGNIWFERTEHTWVDGKCKYCGASQKTLDRGEGLETHAYAFIHTDDIKTRIAELFGGDMQFDVIIGNPPYQLDDGGLRHERRADLPAVRGASEDARTALSVDGHSRRDGSPAARGWTSSGSRCSPTSACARLTTISSASDVFPGRGSQGRRLLTSSGTGTIPGRAEVSTHFKDGPAIDQPVARFLKRAWTCSSGSMKGCRSSRRSLLSRAGKPTRCRCLSSKRFDRLVSSRKPFGLRHDRSRARMQRAPVTLFWSIRTAVRATIARRLLRQALDLIDKWKVFCRTRCSRDRRQDIVPAQDSSARHSLASQAPSATETYLVHWPVRLRRARQRAVLSYLALRFDSLP